MNLCISEGCSARSRNVRKPGMCGACYKRELRARPKCQFEGCNRGLTPEMRTTRKDYCRAHEGELFSKWAHGDHVKAWKDLKQRTEYIPHTGCWIWHGGQVDGYGRAHWPRGLVMTPHRFTYVWSYGGHARGLNVDHLCNESLCCNPTHLTAVRGHLNIAWRDKRNSDPDAPWWPYDKHGNPHQIIVPTRLIWMSTLYGHLLDPSEGKLPTVGVIGKVT